MNLNQVTLPAQDLDAAVAFHRALGRRLIVDALPKYVRFECPDGESTLSVERLASDGIRFDSPPTDQPWLWREARPRDPAGNALCLYQAGRNRCDPPWRVT